MSPPPPIARTREHDIIATKDETAMIVSYIDYRPTRPPLLTRWHASSTIAQPALFQTKIDPHARRALSSRFVELFSPASA
jgi:hypothetical protein